MFLHHDPDAFKNQLKNDKCIIKATPGGPILTNNIITPQENKPDTISNDTNNFNQCDISNSNTIDIDEKLQNTEEQTLNDKSTNNIITPEAIKHVIINNNDIKLFDVQQQQQLSVSNNIKFDESIFSAKSLAKIQCLTNHSGTFWNTNYDENANLHV